MRLALLLVLLASCAGSLRDQTRIVSNGAADVIDAGIHTLLSLYCTDSMAAIGRTGTLTSDGHCRETGLRTGSAATEIEVATLAVVRTRWEPVITAASVVTHSHDTLRSLIAGGTAITDGQILAAVGELATSYESMRQAATAAGIVPPPSLSLGSQP
jgi:hypothetical protein